ncbi:unnamed protein product, partial [Effrenium voratum]
MAKEEDLTEKILEFQRREYAMLSRFAQREREMRKLSLECAEAFHTFDDNRKDSLRGAYVDGAVNLELGLVRQRLRGQDQEMARVREELQNAQFQPNSIQGKKLLDKCAHLLEENSEIARQLSEEKMQVLRIQLAAERQKRLQYRQRIAQLEKYAEQVDAENEKMSKKITELGQNLKETRGEIDRNKKEIEDIKTGKRKHSAAAVPAASASVPPPASAGPAGSPAAPLVTPEGNANVESSFTPLVGAERKRLQALLKAGKTKVDSDLLEKIKGQTLPEVEKNMEYLVARHKLYGHVSLTWSAQPEMVQVKQIARGKAKYIFPPYVSAAGPADEYKRFLAGELECGFERPQYFTTLAAATSGEVIASPTEKPRSAPAGKASNMRTRSVAKEVTQEVLDSWECSVAMDASLAPGAKLGALAKIGSRVENIKQSELGGAVWRYANVSLAGKTVLASSTYGVDYVYAGMKSKDGRLCVATVNNIMK